MKRRNLKAIEILKALKEYGCVEIRKTSHGAIVENPKNNQKINVPLHRKELAVWIYGNILRKLEIDKKDFETNFLK